MKNLLIGRVPRERIPARMVRSGQISENAKTEEIHTSNPKGKNSPHITLQWSTVA